MTKTKTINELNEKIDKLILKGRFNNEFKRLCRLHYQLTH